MATTTFTNDFAGNGTQETLTFHDNIDDAIAQAKSDWLEFSEKEDAGQINFVLVKDGDDNWFFAELAKKDNWHYGRLYNYVLDFDDIELDESDVIDNLEFDKSYYVVQDDELVSALDI